MKHVVSSEVSKARVNRWLLQAKPIDSNTTWTERRQAILFGGHCYLVSNGQVFQCAHCGAYDPEWSSTEVLNYFEEVWGIKPQEVEITCSYEIK